MLNVSAAATAVDSSSKSKHAAKAVPWQVCIDSKDKANTLIPFVDASEAFFTKQFKNILGLGVVSWPENSTFCVDSSAKTSAGLASSLTGRNSGAAGPFFSEILKGTSTG
jgi:hypothetical protein